MDNINSGSCLERAPNLLKCQFKRKGKSLTREKHEWDHGSLALSNPEPVCIFSTLILINFHECCWGEFVKTGICAVQFCLRLSVWLTNLNTILWSSSFDNHLHANWLNYTPDSVLLPSYITITPSRSFSYNTHSNRFYNMGIWSFIKSIRSVCQV